MTNISLFTSVNYKRPMSYPVKTLSFPLLTKVAEALLLQSISFFDTASFTNLRSSSRSLHNLTSQAAHTNPEFMELCVASSLAKAASFREIFARRIEQREITNWWENYCSPEPRTLKRLINKHFLVILSHPAIGATMEHFLQIVDLKTNQEVRLKLVLPIESMEVINGAESTLILAHQTEGVRKATLDQLFQLAAASNSLDIRTLTPVTPHSEKALSLAPTCPYRLWNWETVEKLNKEDFSPVITTRNDLIAIAYQDRITVQDIKASGVPLILNFENARNLTWYNDSLLCVSRDAWALFSLSKNNQETLQSPIVKKCRASDHPPFTFGKRFGNKIVIAQADTSEYGFQIGFIYDLDLKKLKPLIDEPALGGYYALNSVVSHENRLFGASYHYNEWQADEYDLPVPIATNSLFHEQWETTIHTMQKVAHMAISATPEFICLHPLNGRFDNLKLITAKLYPELKGRVNLKHLEEKIVSLDILERYLLIETLKTGHSERRKVTATLQVRVFDLLDSPLTKKSEEKKDNE